MHNCYFSYTISKEICNFSYLERQIKMSCTALARFCPLHPQSNSEGLYTHFCQCRPHPCNHSNNTSMSRSAQGIIAPPKPGVVTRLSSTPRSGLSPTEPRSLPRPSTPLYSKAADFSNRQKKKNLPGHSHKRKFIQNLFS